MFCKIYTANGGKYKIRGGAYLNTVTVRGDCPKTKIEADLTARYSGLRWEEVQDTVQNDQSDAAFGQSEGGEGKILDSCRL